MKTFAENDPVVVPSGRRATVLRQHPNGNVDLRYLDCPVHNPASYVTLKSYLLRKIEPGIVPPPVRLIYG